MQSNYTKGEFYTTGNDTLETVNGLPIIEVSEKFENGDLPEWIAKVIGNTKEEREANAKLFAASPLLYNAAYSALQAIYAMPKSKQGFTNT